MDFDPRWTKRLPAGSFAAQRYPAHIEEQVLAVLEVQNVEVLFVTPAVLSSLAEKINEVKRRAIRGIHLGGMAASGEFMDHTAELFPDAVVLSGYGNTLFGMMPQLRYAYDTGFDYFPHGDRLVVSLIPLGKVSFAFLSDCCKPSLHVIGRNDFLYSDERMAAFRQSVGPAARVVVLEEADHFFRGAEESVARRIEEYLLGTKGDQHGS